MILVSGTTKSTHTYWLAVICNLSPWTAIHEELLQLRRKRLKSEKLALRTARQLQQVNYNNRMESSVELKDKWSTTQWVWTYNRNITVMELDMTDVQICSTVRGEQYHRIATAALLDRQSTIHMESVPYGHIRRTGLTSWRHPRRHWKGFPQFISLL